MNFINYTVSVAWKEIQVISKERGWLVILFLLPLMIGSFMGGANLVMADEEGDAIKINVGLVNQDVGVFGTEMTKVIQTVDVLNVTVHSDMAAAEEQVAKGKNAAVIVIPADFSQKINEYTPTVVNVIVDPAEPESANIVTGIMKQIISEFTIWGEVQYGIRSIFTEAGVLEDANPQEARALEAQNLGVIMTRINEMRTNPVIDLYVEDVEGAKNEPVMGNFFAYLFPGLTVMFIYFIVAMASGTILRERETGTLRRLLTATIPRGSILAGKILAYMLLACAQVLVMLTIASLVFGTPLGESPLGLVVLTLVVAFNAAALGMIIAVVAKTSKQAESIGVVLAFVLAGVGGAIAISPTPFYRAGGVIGIISSLTPQNHAVEGFYRLMAENASFTQVLPQLGISLGMAILFFLIALWRFKFD